MKWIVRACVFIAAIYCGIRTMPVIYVSSGDNTSTTVHYVALGDRIAYGYGLDNPGEESYVGKVSRYLEEKYDYVLTANLGCNGQKSEELLDILTNPDNENYRKYRASIQYADFITLSIGSNDLLKLIELKLDIEEMIEEGDEKYQRACRKFAVNFPEIIRVIREINPEAEIYANNIYNPAKGIPFFANVYQVTEYYIGLINKAFPKNDAYHLIDIKKAFDGQEKSMIKIAVKGALTGGEIDPHPSKEGHDLIAKMVIKEMAGE